MTMRPIDADKLIEWLTNSTGFLANCEDCNSYGRECVLCIVEEAIQNAPTIEAEPVRHGEWIATKIDATVTKFQCSECGREEKCGNDYFMKPSKYVGAILPYCHCGAIMDGGAEE